MNTTLHRTFVVLSLMMALSVSSAPQAVPAQESTRRSNDTERVPTNPEVLDFLDERATVNPKVLEFLASIEVADGDDELVQKMKERHSVATKLLASRVEEYRGHLSDLPQVFEAARLVIEAKLDLATDRDAQLAVYQSALDMSTLIEQHFQTLRDAGLGTASDLQRAQLARLSVEVQILKLKRQP